MFISIQGPALRTYNRVSTILSGLWTKLYSYPAIEVSTNILVTCLVWNLSCKCVFQRNICWFLWNSAQNGGRHWFLFSPLAYYYIVLKALNAWQYDIRRRQQTIKLSLYRSRIMDRLPNWPKCGAISKQAFFLHAAELSRWLATFRCVRVFGTYVTNKTANRLSRKK